MGEREKDHSVRADSLDIARGIAGEGRFAHAQHAWFYDCCNPQSMENQTGMLILVYKGARAQQRFPGVVPAHPLDMPMQAPVSSLILCDYGPLCGGFPVPILEGALPRDFA